MRLSISVSGEGDQAVARVADNAAGIPESERELVFDRFHRANEPAFRGVPGTGLCLYISRQLAEGHGGSLVVESSAPGGWDYLRPRLAALGDASDPGPDGRRRSERSIGSVGRPDPLAQTGCLYALGLVQPSRVGE